VLARNTNSPETVANNLAREQTMSH